MGAGPFFVRDHIAATASRVAGVAAPFDHSSAYGQWGDVMVELIAVHQPATLARDGLHHVAFFVESFDAAAAELEAAGWSLAMCAEAGTTTFAFYEGDLGHFVEIYERSDGLRDFYTMVRDEAMNWSGDDPVRTLR